MLEGNSSMDRWYQSFKHGKDSDERRKMCSQLYIEEKKKTSCRKCKANLTTVER